MAGNDLEFRIGADLGDLKKDLAAAAAEARKFGQQVQKEFTDANGRRRGANGRFLPGNAKAEVDEATRALRDLNANLGGALTAAKALFAAFAASQIAQVFGSAARAGVEFNKQLEDANSAISSLIFAQGSLVDAQGKAVDGAEGLAVAYTLAADQVQKLRIAGLETAATTTDLVKAFQTAVGPGLAAGLNLDEIRVLTIQITQAAGALNVPFDQLSQEIRSILDGSIDVNSRVAKTLGISNEQVKNWQAQGRLVEELNKRLAPFSEAGRAAAQNFSVIASNAKEAADTLGGEVFKGFFEELKSGLADATAGLFDTKNLSVSADLKDAVGFARELATAVGSALADGLRVLVDLAREFSSYVQENREDIEALRGAVGFVAQQFGKLVSSVLSVVAGITDAGIKLNVFRVILETIGVLLAGVRDGFRTIAATVVGLGAIIVKAVLFPFESLLDMAQKVADFLGKGELATFLGDARKQIQQISIDGLQAANDLLAPIAEGRGAVAEAIKDMGKLGEAAAKAQAETKKAAGQAGAGGRITGLRNPPKIPGADVAQLAKADAERALAVLEQGYRDGLVATADYYRERGRLQAAAIDAELAAEREKQARLQKNDENGQRDAATRIALLQKKRQAAVEDNAREELRAARALNEQIDGLRAQDLENQGRSGEATRIRLEAQFRDLLKRLETDGNKAGADLIRKLIDTGAAKARFDELKAQFDRVTQQLQARQQQLADQRNTGAIAPETAEQGVVAARQQALEQLRTINVEIQALAADPNALPAVKQAADEASAAIDRLAMDSLTGLDAAIVELRASLANLQQNLAQNITGAGVDALTNLFTDLASGTKSAGDALKDFVRGFAQSMAQIAARALATYAVLQLLDAVYPGLGRTVAAGMSVGASVNHSGGIIGQGGARRNVDPLLFLGAPRYHSGGMVGLKPDERPAILQTGEEVLARNDPRNAANGGGQGGGNGYRIVNVLDPSLVSGYLESSAGEKAVLNVIGRNPNLVKQSIGA